VRSNPWDAMRPHRRGDTVQMPPEGTGGEDHWPERVGGPRLLTGQGGRVMERHGQD